MPIGISIDEGTIVIATPGGTVRHRNAYAAIDEEGSHAGGSLAVTTDYGAYVVGNAVDDVDFGEPAGEHRDTGSNSDGLGEDVDGADDGDAEGEPERPASGRLFDDSIHVHEELQTNGLEAIIQATLAEVVIDGVDLVGVATPDRSGETGIAGTLDHLNYDVVPIDPGMAVMYDALDAPATGLGIYVGNGTAVGTLAVHGVPVATAQLEYHDRWYDVSRTLAGAGEVADGPIAEWQAIQYEAILADLATDLAGQAPVLTDDIDVALGGSGTPEAAVDNAASVLSTELGYTIGSIRIGEPAVDAPASGALVGVEALQSHAKSGPRRQFGVLGKLVGQRPRARPAFAAPVGFVPALADVSAAIDTFETASTVQRAKTSVSGSMADEEANSVKTKGHVTVAVGDDAGPVVVEERPARIERHRDRLAQAHEVLVTRLQTEDASTQIETFRTEVEAELDRLAAGEEVTALATTLDTLEDSVEDIEQDVSTLRAVIAGVDDDASIEISGDVGGVDSLAIDALKEDITDLDETVSDRIDRLWSEVDEINRELTNVRAGVGDIEDLEGKVNTARNTIDNLSASLDDLRRNIAEVSESVEDVEERAATTGQVQAVEEEIRAVQHDLSALEDRLRNLNVADPEQVRVVERDLSALQDTVVNTVNRLEGVERTTSDLEDRIEQAFKDTAKAEAVSSVQADVSRMRNTVSSANEMAQEAATTADELQGKLDFINSIEDDLDQLNRRLDVVVENSITRSEVDNTVGDLEGRLQAMEEQVAGEAIERRVDERIAQYGNRGVATEQMLQVIAVGLVGGGGIGAWLAFEVLEGVELAAGFALLMAGPGLVLFYLLMQ